MGFFPYLPNASSGHLLVDGSCALDDSSAVDALRTHARRLAKPTAFDWANSLDGSRTAHTAVSSSARVVGTAASHSRDAANSFLDVDRHASLPFDPCPLGGMSGRRKSHLMFLDQETADPGDVLNASAAGLSMLSHRRRSARLGADSSAFLGGDGASAPSSASPQKAHAYVHRIEEDVAYGALQAQKAVHVADQARRLAWIAVSIAVGFTVVDSYALWHDFKSFVRDKGNVDEFEEDIEASGWKARIEDAARHAPQDGPLLNR
eukprot:TRINITY_DN26817_c0_g1_i1.p1 TRINITY_DN26817_c0_g1~~TRINITY_DN26817_c0_g1_i1.p1  ORF type:complete len:304 (+),score=30.57 TRINITY_DN26817_c0_g1_i1:124-912(+)